MANEHNIVNPIKTSGSVTIAEIATPSTPDSGFGKTYFKSDHLLYQKDSLGVESLVGAAASTVPDQSYELSNLSISATVAANALTIALKTKAGVDASGGSIIKIGFRNSTAATGTYNQRSVSAALSLVISSGSTLGHANGVTEYIYVYAIDNAGTVELAASTGLLFDEGSVATTVAEGGAGNADTRNEIYSTTARSNVPIRLIGRIEINEASIGTWATAPTEIALIPFLNDTGSKTGATPKVGHIGEQLSNTGNAVAQTGSRTVIVTLTLTTGLWLVSGSGVGDNGATQTGADCYFYQKGVNGAVTARDIFTPRYGAGVTAGSWAATFAPRVLIIATADSDKTIEIRAQAITATVTVFGYLSAVRIA